MDVILDDHAKLIVGRSLNAINGDCTLIGLVLPVDLICFPLINPRLVVFQGEVMHTLQPLHL